jgi:phosphoribosylamine--glycine ligase
MNVLILGSGSREHALAQAIAPSPQCDQLLIVPGNAGTSKEGTNISAGEDDFEGIKNLVLKNKIDLVVPGPEKPLAAGLVDAFRDDPELSVDQVLGPDQAAAQLESSKAFAKRFMHKHQIPTGAYQVFEAQEKDKALEALQAQQPPYVIKADGLAAGKGVAICETREEAERTLEAYMVEKSLGSAGQQVVLESYLEGPEFSVFVLTDGQQWLTLPDAQDYKRAYDNDQGPNTGGMGAVAPAENLTKPYRQKVQEEVIKPTIEGLKAEGFHYRGFLYFGLIDVQGEPHVLEYNVRLGDPEASAILPLVKADLLPALQAAAAGQLTTEALDVQQQVATTVVVASGGYPGAYEKGKAIHGTGKITRSLVNHAGTKQAGGNLLTAGGRVLAVTGLGADREQATQQAYSDVQKVNFDQMQYRLDIGQVESSTIQNGGI